MSLREEVKKYFDTYFEGKPEYECETGIMTYSVLKLIEKRIDELLPDSEYQLITKGRLKEMLK